MVVSLNKLIQTLFVKCSETVHRLGVVLIRLLSVFSAKYIKLHILKCNSINSVLHCHCIYRLLNAPVYFRFNYYNNNTPVESTLLTKLHLMRPKSVSNMKFAHATFSSCKQKIKLARRQIRNVRNKFGELPTEC